MSLQSPPVVALPETRHLDVLASLLERRGVAVMRCPMVGIHDAPDQEAVTGWIERFCDGRMDLFVVYTGEGIERLTAAADRAGTTDRFIAALGSTPLLTRGPKPARVLRRFGIRPEYPALAPTTDGVIETLDQIQIAGQRIGVQLYGGEALPQLTDYLDSRGATADCVAPYVYASEADDQAVEVLIGEIADGGIDAIAFTSKSQVERLARVAGRANQPELAGLLSSVVVAAVGPVAAAALEHAGVRVDVVPESDFFMKPMVTALMSRLEREKGV
jgi:uroporphyrinogen-III synthase